MARVEIYSTAICPYCMAAKNLLKQRGLEFTEFLIDRDSAKRVEMLERSNQSRTVPQIFVNGEHIGGYDDLVKSDRDGRLAELVAATP